MLQNPDFFVLKIHKKLNLPMKRQNDITCKEVVTELKKSISFVMKIYTGKIYRIKSPESSI